MENQFSSSPFLVNSGSLYSQDRILQAMGNITLAFHLLCERANPNSFWLPYIQTLPSEYDTPLYFEEDEVQYLQSTQAIHDVFSQYKNTARQYAYFYKVIQVRISNIVYMHCSHDCYCGRCENSDANNSTSILPLKA